MMGKILIFVAKILYEQIDGPGLRIIGSDKLVGKELLELTRCAT